MKKSNSNSTNNAHLEFWASYWNLTAEQLRSIIVKIGSSSFLQIQKYMESKLTKS